MGEEMNCPYCDDKLEYDFCNTCGECTVDLDSSCFYGDSEAFEQADTLGNMMIDHFTDEFRNEV